MAVDLEGLRQFLLEANKAGYASKDNSSWIKQPDGSTTIHYQSREWLFDDNFFGGEPYGGREVISYRGQVVWIMVYYGWVEPWVEDVKTVESFLQDALSSPPEDLPLRGPARFKPERGDLLYTNTWRGDLGSFSGEEMISRGDHNLPGYISWWIGR